MSATSLHRVAAPRFSRFDLPAAAAQCLAGEPRQALSDVEALPATRLRATSLHRVAEQAGGRTRERA
jgi:hypothetical protein